MVKTQVRPAIISDLLFADDAALAAANLQEVPFHVDRFSAACKAFGLNISIAKAEVIHQPYLTPIQIQGVK